MIATKKKIAMLMVVAIMAMVGMMMTNNLTGVHASAADGEPVSYTAGSSEITLEIGDPGMKLDRGRN